jgi:heterotetrameric sarcosine oxidase gamma subunit
MKGIIKPLARTPLYYWHVAHGAHMMERDGWAIPASYSNVEQEVAAARAGPGLVDVSACGKIAFRGRGAAGLIGTLAGGISVTMPRSVGEFDAAGRVLACRLAEDHLLLLALTANATALRARLRALRGDIPLLQTDVTSAYAMFCLLGTATEGVLNRLTAFDVRRSTFRPGSCAETNVAGVHAALIRPAGDGLDTVYVAVAWDLAEHIWESLLNAVPPHDSRPVGLDAWHRIISASLAAAAASS